MIQFVGLTESIKNSEFFILMIFYYYDHNIIMGAITIVVVYRNYEAGKQLVISTINGNDSLGWVDVLTRVDLRRKFQYFLYIMFKSQIIIN